MIYFSDFVFMINKNFILCFSDAIKKEVARVHRVQRVQVFRLSIYGCFHVRGFIGTG